MRQDREPEQSDPTDPFGLTPMQRAYSDASKVVDTETPPWWTRDFRDAIIHMRIMDEMRIRAAKLPGLDLSNMGT